MKRRLSKDTDLDAQRSKDLGRSGPQRREQAGASGKDRADSKSLHQQGAHSFPGGSSHLPWGAQGQVLVSEAHWAAVGKADGGERLHCESPQRPSPGGYEQ